MTGHLWLLGSMVGAGLFLVLLLWGPSESPIDVAQRELDRKKRRT